MKDSIIGLAVGLCLIMLTGGLVSRFILNPDAYDGPQYAPMDKMAGAIHLDLSGVKFIEIVSGGDQMVSVVAVAEDGMRMVLYEDYRKAVRVTE